MATLLNIIDMIRSGAQNGMSTNDSRFEDLYLEERINSARAVTIPLMMQKNKMFNSAWVQQLPLSAIDRNVEDCVVYFECPTVISIDSTKDGFVYVGHVEGKKPFIRLKSEKANLTMHSTVQEIPELKWSYSTGIQGNNEIAVYGNKKLENILIRGVFNNPTSIPNYRKDKDQYPIDRVGLQNIVDMVTLDIFNKNRIPPDYVSDGNDKPSR